MALKGALQRLRTPVSELDLARLKDYCDTVEGTTRIGDLVPREQGTVVGEISSLRIVPRPDGSSWLEATITDGTGSLVAMWTGRTHIAGVKPGRRLVLKGRGSPTGPGGRLVILNPWYELLA